MVQEFQVLRCFSCQTFQVHQVKKSKKWACKLCGEKQSFLKVYGQGSGADCRVHVQKLNLLQGEVEQAANSSAMLNWQTDDYEKDFLDDLQSPGLPQETIVKPNQASLSACTSVIRRVPSPQQQSEPGIRVSRWSKYVEEESDEGCVKQKEDDFMMFIDQNITPAARKRKKLPEYGIDQDACRGFLNIPKKNRVCEEWSASTREVPPPCIKSEKASAMGHPGRTVSRLTEETSFSSCKWERFITSEDESKENLSSTHRLQITAPNMVPALNTLQHGQKAGAAFLPPRVAGSQAAETETSLSHKAEMCELMQKEDHLLPGCKPKPSIDSCPQNVYCSIFQTDEDFDDEY